LSWLLKNARIDSSKQLYHLLFDDSQIIDCLPNDHDLAELDAQQWDLEGKVVLPGLVEPHAHLDKTYTPITNDDGTLTGAIASMREFQQQRNYDQLKVNVDRAVRQAISHGVTHLRSHVDIASEADFERVAVIDDVRQHYSEHIHIELTALSNMDSEQGKALVASSLERGVNNIGGAPVFSDNPSLAITHAVELAHETGAAIDLHLDENNDPNSGTLANLVEQVTATNWQGPVSASHCCSLGFMADNDRLQLIDKVANANIDVVTLPACNLVLIGRGQQPKPRGATPVKELLNAGVNVAVGADNVQDPFNPFGNYDPLASAQINAQVAQLTSTGELLTAMQMVMHRAAKVLRLDNYGIAKGNPAHLVVLNSTDYLSAVTGIPERLATFFNGKNIVKTHFSQSWSIPSLGALT